MLNFQNIIFILLLVLAFQNTALSVEVAGVNIAVYDAEHKQHSHDHEKAKPEKHEKSSTHTNTPSNNENNAEDNVENNYRTIPSETTNTYENEIRNESIQNSYANSNNQTQNNSIAQPMRVEPTMQTTASEYSYANTPQDTQTNASVNQTKTQSLIPNNISIESVQKQVNAAIPQNVTTSNLTGLLTLNNLRTPPGIIIISISSQ